MLFFVLLNINVFAKENIIDKSVKDYLPDQIVSLLNEYGFKNFNAKELVDISLNDIIDYITTIIKTILPFFSQHFKNRI